MRVLLLPFLPCVTACAPSSVQTDSESVKASGRSRTEQELEVGHKVARPDEFGQKWNFQLSVSPVLPKLIKGNLSDPSSLHFGL